MNTSPARSKLIAVAVALLVAVATVSGCTVSVDSPFVGGTGSGSGGGDVADPSGCFSTSEMGTSSNAGMQELARGLYDSLTCDGDVPIEEQLINGANDPAFKQRAADVGATVDIVEGASTSGGAEFTAEVWLWDERNPQGTTVCSILIIANPYGKTLMCEDVASGASLAAGTTRPARDGGSQLFA
jgi:hypothetical protein